MSISYIFDGLYAMRIKALLLGNRSEVGILDSRYIRSQAVHVTPWRIGTGLGKSGLSRLAVSTKTSHVGKLGW